MRRTRSLQIDITSRLLDLAPPNRSRTFGIACRGCHLLFLLEGAVVPGIGVEVTVISTSIWPPRTPAEVQSRPRSSRVPLVILELFVGLGGIFGGLEMIRHPLNAFGVTTDLIAGSPFDTIT